MARGKYRWFKLLLYPDNEVHRVVMDFLKSSKNTMQGFYIEHEPEEEEKKKHWHVTLYCANPRTPDGLAKSFGMCKLLTIDENEKKEVFDDTGIEYTECEEHYIFRYLKNKDGSINSASNISEVKDITAWTTYILHKDFKSMIKRKKEYDIQSIKPFNSDYDIIEKAFSVSKISPKGSEIVRICNFIDDCQLYTVKDVMLTLCSAQEYDLIDYAEKHAYLITQLLKGG